VLNARFDRAAWPFGVALLIAGLTRLCLPFDGLFGQDAFAYFRFARAIGPHLLAGAPLPDLFWPRGYPVAVAALLPLAGGGPFAGQLVSALACAAAAAATFLLVRELDGLRGVSEESTTASPTARVVAAVCAAASGALLRSGQVVMADGLGIGLCAVTLWCFARHLRTRRGPWLVACAVALAWGAVTRWQIGLCAFPLGVAAALDGRAGRRGGDRRWWAVAILAGLAVLIPQLVAAHAVPHALEQHEWLQKWSPRNAFGRDFLNSEGHVHYRFPVAIFYLLRLGWPDALFPTVTALAVVGAAVLIRERRGVEGALLVGWPLCNWAFISGIPYENPRFLWPALPAICALAGIGYQCVHRRLPARSRPFLVLALVGSLVAGLVFGAREHAHTVARKNADRATVDWIDAQVPAGTTLIALGGTLMLEHYGTVRVRDVYLLPPAELSALLARDCPCLYLENPAEIEGPAAGLRPRMLFEALRRAATLTPIATRPPLVLYRLGPPP
jgi:Dolichyl-phosphate-mannose-protein mannosyltransferase